MKKEIFLNENKQDLQDFITMSHGAAARVDYIQGGGGNTSVKLDNGWMAIKASGYSMGQITFDEAYAVLDAKKLKKFYMDNINTAFDDMEASGAAEAKECAIEIEGLEPLRPSVEAGFHSILKKYVLHSHSVYGNLVACSENASSLWPEIMSKTNYGFALVPYVDPGARLTFTIQEACAKNQSETGKDTDVILMSNHGLIVQADTAEEATQIHEKVNQVVADFFHVSFADFPTISIKEVGGKWQSSTLWLQERLVNEQYTPAFFMEQPLYPDQLVFLSGQVEKVATEKDVKEAPCTIVAETGNVYYNCNYAQALVIEQTLCCVLFIVETIEKNGYTVQSMNEQAKDFIANWESEKYRKSLVK